MKSIAIIVASASDRNSINGDNCLIGWWRSMLINQAKSIVLNLLSSKSEKVFHVKVVTCAAKDSTLVREMESWGVENIISEVKCYDASALTVVLQDSHAAFVLTEHDYSIPNSLNEEVKVGRAIADACKMVGLTHVIYSSRMHVNAFLGLRSDACDAKAHISDYMDKIGLPKTILHIPFLYEDFLYGFMKPNKTDKSNVYKIFAPIGHIPLDMVSAEDVGICIRSLLLHPSTWLGKTVALSGDRMTLQEYSNIMTDIVYPARILDGKVTPEEFIEIFNMTGAEDMANYFDFLTRSVQRKDHTTTMVLHPTVMSFYDWARINKGSINAIVS